MISRRSFIAGLALGLAAAPLTTGAQQQRKTWRVAFLSGGGRPTDGLPPRPLREALQELGYIEQQNVIYVGRDRKSTRLNSSHSQISYAVFCLKKKKKKVLLFFIEQKKKKK